MITLHKNPFRLQRYIFFLTYTNFFFIFLPPYLFFRHTSFFSTPSPNLPTPPTNLTAISQQSYTLSPTNLTRYLPLYLLSTFPLSTLSD